MDQAQSGHTGNSGSLGVGRIALSEYELDIGKIQSRFSLLAFYNFTTEKPKGTLDCKFK